MSDALVQIGWRVCALTETCKGPYCSCCFRIIFNRLPTTPATITAFALWLHCEENIVSINNHLRNVKRKRSRCQRGSQLSTASTALLSRKRPHERPLCLAAGLGNLPASLGNMVCDAGYINSNLFAGFEVVCSSSL